METVTTEKSKQKPLLYFLYLIAANQKVLGSKSLIWAMALKETATLEVAVE